MSLWLFKSVPRWVAWRDTKVAAYYRQTDRLNAIWAAIEALPADLREVIDDRHLPSGLPEWFPDDRADWLDQPEGKHAVALSHIREYLKEASVVTSGGAVVA